MSVYAVAQISIHNRERYETYMSRFMPILTRYEGRILVADENVDVLEGKWPYDKIIILSFKDRPSLERWANSPEYQEISKDRVAGTDGVVLVVNGVGR
jgi:uncharacterized protein (DUF1330 family)